MPGRKRPPWSSAWTSADPLPRDVQERLIALAGRHVTSHRVLVVVSRAYRSQVENREAARARLVGLLRLAATPRKARKPTKPNRVELHDRMIAKERHSALKRARRGRDDD
jgi:ribosome-associated protein